MTMLTDDQKQAVQSEGRNILVEAGAGSGKTRVLVERIAYLIEEKGVSPDAILALTFTDKATREMKTRVSQRLGRDMHSVLTFHRFCGRVLREHPLTAGVDPDFSMLEGARAKQVLRSLLTGLLRTSEDQEVGRRLEQMGVEVFLQAVLSVYEKMRTLAPTSPSLLQGTEKKVHALRSEQWQALRESVEGLIALHQEQRITAAGTKKRLQEIAEGWNGIPAAIRESVPESWDEPAIQQVRAAAERVFQQVSGNVAQETKPFFARLSVLKKDRLWEDLLMDSTRELRASICQFVTRLDEAYTAYKREQGCCDFSDLEMRAWRLLSENTDVRECYGRTFAHVLVDEYQDTNPVQQAILELLREGRGESEGSLFMVGDPRQSIYRFRGADVRGFLEIKKGLEAEDECVELRDNFRMSESLGAWVQEVSRGLFNLEGGEDEKQVADAEVVAELLVPAVLGTDSKHEREADMLARRIWQVGAGRFGDVAVLLQTRTHQSVFGQAFSRYGIPYVMEEDAAFWKRQEVQDVLHVLQLLVEPEDSVALLGFLRGPLVRCSNALLWKIAQREGLTEGFWASEEFAVQEVKRQLAKWRQQLEHRRVADWLYEWLYGQGMEEMLGGGSLEMFVEWAQEAEENGMVSLAELLAWWRQMEMSGERVHGGEAVKEEGQGCVRIMTIHAAKGLEFPIVCLPDLTHPHTLRMEGLHLCEEYGLTLKEQDHQSTSSQWRPTLSYAAAARLEKEALVAEKKRLFYVGLTRAKECVILSGAATRFTEKATLEECSNWWDWLPNIVPGLRGTDLGEAVLEGRGWKMKVVPDESVVGELAVETRTRRVLDAGGRKVEARSGERVEYADTEKVWSVTGLVKRLSGELSDGASTPVGRRLSRFVRAADLQPYEWGQVVHALLEHLRPDDTEETIREVRLPAAFASRGFTGRERMDEVWERVRVSVQRYRESELFREYRAAQERYHEMPFLLEWVPGLPVSGVIDVLWLREDGKATVVDFKTQPCRTEKEMEEVAERYKMQVTMYAAVAERLLGWKVDRVGVYLTEAGRFVEVEYEKGAEEGVMKELVRGRGIV